MSHTDDDLENSTDDTSFRITFNLPAQNKYFDEETVSGIRIKIDEDVIMFQAAHESDHNTVAFTNRPRGGCECIIDGTIAGEMLSLLMKEASPSQPFFDLIKLDQGWITIQHYKGEGAPPKFVPHMRVWPPRDRIEAIARPPIDDEITEVLGNFASLARVAKQLINDYDAERRVGRPPSEIIEAREVIIAFQNLAKEILPDTNLAGGIKMVQTAHNALVGFLQTYANSTSEKQRKAPIKSASIDIPSAVSVQDGTEDPKPVRKRGRPLGSKNRPKFVTPLIPVNDIETEHETVTDADIFEEIDEVIIDRITENAEQVANEVVKIDFVEHEVADNENNVVQVNDDESEVVAPDDVEMNDGDESTTEELDEEEVNDDGDDDVIIRRKRISRDLQKRRRLAAPTRR
ncbi:unnamed protein product [Sphagnum tenellum]